MPKNYPVYHPKSTLVYLHATMKKTLNIPLIHFLLPAVSCVILFQACHSRLNVPELTVTLNDSCSFSVSEWKLIGPFLTDIPLWQKSGPLLRDSVNGQELMNYDNLSSFGLNEANLNFNQLNRLKIHTTDSLFKIPEDFERLYQNLHGLIELKDILNTNKPGNLYAACILNSKSDQDIVLLSGGDEQSRIYLNGTRIESPMQDPYRIVNQNYIFARLKKGKNYLLVKLTNTIKSTVKSDEPWRFLLCICTPRRYNDYFIANEKIILKYPVTPVGGPIVLHNQIHPVDPVKRVEILDNNHTLIKTCNYSDSIAINGLDFGLYKLKIITERNSYQQDFYYGDIHEGILELYTKAKTILAHTSNVAIKCNISPLVDRYDTLYQYYKRGDFFTISEAHNNGNYTPIQSVVIKPKRLIKLNKPKYVKLERINLEENPIAEIQFFKESDGNFIQIPFLQTNCSDVLNTTSVTTKSLALSPCNDPLLDTLYFKFPENELPDYMQILTKDKLTERESDRNYIFIYNELHSIITRIEKGEEAFKNIPGTHLRSFISPADESLQYYMVQCPESVTNDTAPKPVILTIPWVYGATIPFLRSFIIARINTLEQYERYSNKNDFIIIHPNGRTYNNVVTEPIGFKNIFRTLEAVKKDYNIDTTRLHLYAYCGGSEFATTMATTYPGKFASVAIIEGMTLSPDNSWDNSIYSVNYTENLSNTPVYIIHGESDTHVSYSSINDFVKLARKKGNSTIRLDLIPQLTFQIYPRLLHEVDLFSYFTNHVLPVPKEIEYATSQYKYHQSFWLDLYPQYSGIRANMSAQVDNNSIYIKVKQAKKISIHTNQAPIDQTRPLRIIVNNDSYTYNPPYSGDITLQLYNDTVKHKFQKNALIEGPILHAFSEKFILVRGTSGTPAQQKSINRMLDQFVSTWYACYYVKPIVRNDFEISPEDYQTSTLVLFGNPKSNKVFDELSKDLPLSINENSITLGKRTFEGKSLEFYFNYPNPKNHEKYLVLIGGNDLQKVKPRNVNLAHSGYYDYEIYFNDEGSQYLIEQGMFNEYWELN